MTTLDSMLERNKDFAASQSAARELMPRALPNVKAIIIGCADMRVDPAHVLGIKPGEAVVIRNIGGRITPGLLEQLGMLGRIGEVAGAIPGGGGEFHLIVLQHTNCGITYLAEETAMLTRYFKMQEGELKTKAVTDPRAAVATDVACSGRLPHCRGGGLSPASSTMWGQDLSRSLYHQSRFVRFEPHKSVFRSVFPVAAIQTPYEASRNRQSAKSVFTADQACRRPQQTALRSSSEYRRGSQ
jgi:carbonic anhydrase